jgi:hypothetical protein
MIGVIMFLMFIVLAILMFTKTGQAFLEKIKGKGDK